MLKSRSKELTLLLSMSLVLAQAMSCFACNGRRSSQRSRSYSLSPYARTTIPYRPVPILNHQAGAKMHAAPSKTVVAASQSVPTERTPAAAPASVPIPANIVPTLSEPPVESVTTQASAIDSQQDIVSPSDLVASATDLAEAGSTLTSAQLTTVLDVWSQPAEPTKQLTHVGRWQSMLGPQTQVELELRDDDSFRWTAKQADVAASFSGTYELVDQQLTLIRDVDGQRLSGVWSLISGDEARLQLEGADRPVVLASVR